MYDLCLKTEHNSKIRYLSLDEVLEILDRLGARRVILMGWEPTVDPELPALTERLHRSGIHSILPTNGHDLNERLLESVNKICVSIKARSDELHKKFTGKFQ
jgi:MoaA/NifB/PqqE/SkfB family radical SAM enzyme